MKKALSTQHKANSGKKKLGKEDVLHVGKLANLDLKEAEIEKFTEQLSEIIDYNMNLLGKVDTSNIEPTAHAIGVKNIVRTDETSPSLPQEEVLKNAKKSERGFFITERILEK